jgi:putative FmdB family regulatory protein
MPFYEYECASCRFYSEVMQKISDPPLKKCPSCGRNTLKKLVSAPIFRLKGGGWYETDFKSDKENKRNLAVDKEPEKSGEGGGKASSGESKVTEPKAAESKPAESKPAAGSGGGARRSSARKAAPARSKPKKAAAKRRARR